MTQQVEVKWADLDDMTQDILWAEQIGQTECEPGEGQHYTLSGIRVSEPSANWGMDYWNLSDAIDRGCTPLKPSVRGLSGVSQELVNELLEKHRHLI